jgi:mono/diheme cytochrome c family protein
MPAAQFAQPTTMITVAPSDTVTQSAPAEAGGAEAVTDTVAATNTPTAAAAAPPAPAGGESTAEQARGQELYATRKCGDCHGANAEGVPDKGSAVAGTPLALEEFTDLLRTGGEIGPDHLYGPMTISPSGVSAIHAWLQALPAE